MDMTVRSEEQELVVELAGPLEPAAVGLVRTVADVARAEHRRLLVDVSDAENLDVELLDRLSEVAAGAWGRVLLRA